MACLLCNSKNVKRLEKLCGNMKILGDSFPDAPSYLNTCMECGLVYVDMDATQDDILSYYTSGNCKPICYRDLFGASHTEEYFEHILASVSPYLKKDSKLLDIGGGLGEFAEFLVQKGFQNITIMDPADISISAAGKKGLRAIQADSTQYLNAEEGQYDLIFLIHVFEHIYEQNKTLGNIKNMLKADGHLYLEVPDASKFCHDDLAPYYYYTYEHVAHMNRCDLKNIGNISGMRLLELGEYLKCGHYPAVFGIYQNGDEIKEVSYHASGENNAKDYLELCKRKSGQMGKRFTDSDDTLVLWGIGASTAQLVTSCFGQCRIRALVDNNPKRQGVSYEIGGKSLAIISPFELKDIIHEPDVIVVMSIMYKEAIVRQIREMGFEQRIEALSMENLSCTQDRN